MSDEKPEALLKSALEKIVYFEARSTQLSNDAGSTRAELERVKADLSAASQREIELRRVIAELEVRATRAHADREEMARLVDALRRERAELVGKMLEASRIHGLDQGVEGFDLAQFIATLRSEVLVQRDGGAPVQVSPAPQVADTVTSVAQELKGQGRIGVTANDLATLRGGLDFPGRSEETLFGFSVRELSALDPSARMRAAERLEALRHPAAAPALATALHGETEAAVQVALLSALASLAQAEAVPVVQPLLTSKAPDVRIAALKALLKLDAAAAGPHLAAATKDPDKAVRRRASLLALGLAGNQAFELGSQAIRDVDADVRALAALVLGASNAEVARPMLLDAMRDPDLRVRRAASQSMSRLLGRDVTSLVTLDDAHRRREVRRLSTSGRGAEPGTTSATQPAVASSVAVQQVVGSSVVTRQHVAPVVAQHVAPVVAQHVAPVAAPSVAAQHVAPIAASSVAVQHVAPIAASSVAAQHVAPVAASSVAAQHLAPVVGSSVAPSPLAAHHPLAPVVAQPVAPTGVQHVTSPAAHQVASAVAQQQQFAQNHFAASVAQPVAAQHHPAPVMPAPAAASAYAPHTSRVAVLDVAPASLSPELTASVLRELRASIRGRPLPELSAGIGASQEDTMRACGELLSSGQIVRRGLKYFVA